MLEQLDDHIISLQNIILQPGGNRRISFRGTPGGQVSVRIFPKIGPNSGDTEEPIDDLPIKSTPVGDLLLQSAKIQPTKNPSSNKQKGTTQGINRYSKIRQFKASGRRSKKRHQASADLLLKTLLSGQSASREEGNDVLFSQSLPNNLKKPFLTISSGGDLTIVEPDQPPVQPPEIDRPPMQIRIAVQGGATLRDEVVTSDFRSPSSVPKTGPFPGHDIIEVNFTNPNDYPVNLQYIFINVQNDLIITDCVLPPIFLERVINNTILYLSPSFGIRNGKFYFGFPKEVNDTYGLTPYSKDLDFDLDATINIEPVDFELLSQESVIRRIVTEMEEEIKAVRLNNVKLPEVPDDFVEKTVSAFFSPSMTLPHLFSNSMNLSEFQWKKALNSRPILVVHPQLAGNREDVAICFHLRLTDAEVESEVLELNVDTIKAQLFMVLRNGNRPETHPVSTLRYDFVNAGYIIPRFQLSVDVSGFDIDVDLPGGFLTKPLEWIIEGGADLLADYIEDYLEDIAVNEGMKYLRDCQFKIGEFATSIMNEIANRYHFFRRLYTENGNWIIETLDPAQLAVPYIEPDNIDHRFDDIGINVETPDPIDGPMPEDASNRLARVDHLVFLMMENRSFDHMFGYLSHPNHSGRQDIDGLDGRSRSLGGDYVGTQATPQSSPRLSFAPNPGHSAETVAIQIADGAMNGFVSEFARKLENSDDINPQGNLNNPERILKFHTAEQLPTYNSLSFTDVVLDRWFCSIPGGTYPNRSCYYTGITPAMNNSEIFNDAGYHTELTLFDVLDKESIDWIVYESDLTFLRMFEKYRLEMDKIKSIDDFCNRSDALPPVTFIDPNFKGAPSSGPANDDHAPVDVTAGQEFIKKVITKLTDLPSWPTTMLVIIYDEHGGFADHVPPPGTASSDFPPAADGSPTIPLAHPDAYSYGVRIPAIVVSPLVEAGGVGRRPRTAPSRIYDHATVYRTVIERFMPQLRNSRIIPERVRQARHLGEVVEPEESNLGFTGRRFPQTACNPVSPVEPESSAIIRTAGDAFRPHLTALPDTDDFHNYMTRLGNPIKLD